MKRHQQHRSKPLQSLIPARSSQRNRHKSGITVALSRFLWTRPLAVLGGAWVVMVVVALVAVSGLLSPESSNGKRTAETASVRPMTKTLQREQHQNRLPLWLFGAIAVSCAAGSMLVAKQATRPPRPQARSPKLKARPLMPYPAPSAIEEAPSVPESVEPSLSSISHSPVPTPPPSFVLEPRRTQAAGTTPSVTLMQLAQMQLNQTKASSAAGQPTVAPVKAAPVQVASVTVVPPEEKSPLDWGEASLADQLNLRKQRSVSFSLRT